MDQEKLRLLTRPFADIKSRPGRNGQSIQYVEAHSIVQRLNDALAGDWSFRVLEREILDGEVIVLGELRAGEVVKQAFGGSEVTKTRDGKIVGAIGAAGAAASQDGEVAAAGLAAATAH